MITVSEAAQRAGVKPNVIYRLIHSGDLPAYRMPGRNTLMLDELQADQAMRPLPVRTEPKGPDYLTPNEVSRLLHCSVKTVRTLVLQGHLSADRNPGYRSRMRIHAASVEQYLQQSRVSA